MAFLRPASDSTREATVETRALYLRPPQMRDWRDWAELRALSREFLSPWEPTWPSDALTRTAGASAASYATARTIWATPSSCSAGMATR